MPASARVWLYRLALERGYFDAFLNDYVVAPFVSVLEFFDKVERWWSGLLSGWATRESDQLNPYSGQIEDLP
jgi:NAD(P)H-quinone oxidoreductase subunit 5